MGLTGGTDIGFTLDLVDKATPKYEQFVGEVKTGAGEVSTSVGQATTAFNEHGKTVSAATALYREHRGEIRMQNFFRRELMEVVNAGSFALLGFMGTQDGADEGQKKLNKSVMEGFMAFQGLNFVISAAGMGGPWGLAIAAVAGLAVGLAKLTSNAKEASEAQKTLAALQSAYYSSLSGPLLKQRLDQETQSLDNLEEEKKTTLALIEAEAQYTEGEMGVQRVEGAHWVEYKKHIADVDRSITQQKDVVGVLEATYQAESKAIIQLKAKDDSAKALAAATRSNEITLASLNAQLDTFEKSLQTTPLGTKAFDELLQKITAVKEQIKHAQEMLELPAETVTVDVGHMLEIDREIERERLKGFQDEKLKELFIVEDWLAKVKRDHTASDTQKIQAEQVASARIIEIQKQAHLKAMAQWKDEHEYITGPISAGIGQIGDALKGQSVTWQMLWDSMKNAAIGALVKIVEQGIINAIAASATQATATAATIAYMSAIEVASVGAAMATSIATFGASAAAGEAAFLEAMAVAHASTFVPKFHEGGVMSSYGSRLALASDERPAVLKVGETVRTPEQEASLKSGGTVNITVNINAPGTPVDMVKKALEDGCRATGLSITQFIQNQNTRAKVAVA